MEQVSLRGVQIGVVGGGGGGEGEEEYGGCGCGELHGWEGWVGEGWGGAGRGEGEGGSFIKTYQNQITRRPERTV